MSLPHHARAVSRKCSSFCAVLVSVPYDVAALNVACVCICRLFCCSVTQSMAQMREDLYEELTPDDPEPLIHDDDLERLQLRLLGLFEAELLSEEEYLKLEDLAADFAELQSTAPGGLVTRDCAPEL